MWEQARCEKAVRSCAQRALRCDMPRVRKRDLSDEMDCERWEVVGIVQFVISSINKKQSHLKNVLGGDELVISISIKERMGKRKVLQRQMYRRKSGCGLLRVDLSVLVEGMLA